MRVLVALGGNAMTGPDGSARPQAQWEAVTGAMEHVAELVRAGHDVVLTHGNGPQVGNILVQNEFAAHVVPPLPLDWCGAQTQGTIGYLILVALESALAGRGVERPVAAIVSRTLVDSADPGFARPSKPIGRYLPLALAQKLIDHGETWEDRGAKGWRRVVASPEPLEMLEAHTLRTLLDAGYLVTAAGGGGIPVVRTPDGRLVGVDAVIDKDLTAALLAERLHADVLVLATDVEHAMIGYGSPHARPIGRVSVGEMEQYAAQGHFASGSMGPKVEAALRFVRAGGRSVITAVHQITAGVAGAVGTVIDGAPTSPARPTPPEREDSHGDTPIEGQPA
ncbi:MAG: carbamate kinase [Intrasporangium sp.]|uniref:carbamate kinase n=1 Tax=Intrasporangium sp. TaxID=1925024 RepID=UPI002649A581|nr:carbamate kinase [Intrasporangium sp.]MDN5794541.1 carbamate kinase [Intrasporangium sp.]